MKKNMKWTVCLAAVVLAFAAVWFLAQGLQERQAARSLAAASAAGAAEEPDLTGWDVSVRGEGLDGSYLACGGGTPVYLLLDGAEVYLQQPEDGGGDCLKSSPTVLYQILRDQGDQQLHLWLTQAGKVEQIAVCGAA